MKEPLILFPFTITSLKYLKVSCVKCNQFVISFSVWIIFDFYNNPFGKIREIPNPTMSTSKIPQTSTTKSTTSSSNLIPISRKRTPRQRNPVVLLQDQYSQIYATHNNRKIKPTQPKHSSSKLQNPGLPASAIINETANKQNKDHKSSSIISHSLQKTTRLPPTYRWIGNSIIESDGNTYYEKLEIKVGNHASLISVGDSVLLSSGDLEEDELFCKPDASSPLTQQGGNIGNKLSKASSIKNLASSANKNATEISKIESLVNEIAINSLNPYVALVDSIFEEPLTEIEKSVCNSENNKRRKKNDIVSYTEQRRTRMKIRAKWYFKVNFSYCMNGKIFHS